MRYAPAAIALSLVVGVSASVGMTAPREPDPRAVALASEGEAKLQAGDTQGAIDKLEAALAVDPGYNRVYVALADAVRAEGLQGKAIHYYREAQEREPENLAAIAGEGEALVEKGAVERARENLAQLEGLCGSGCLETQALAAAIDRGPAPRMATVEMPVANDSVAQN